MISKDVTELVTNAVTGYWVKKRWAVHQEFGIVPRGRQRLDVFALTMSGWFVGCEVKRDWADFKKDLKWPAYLSCVDSFYFCLPTAQDAGWVADELRAFDDARRDVGVLYLNQETGWMSSCKNAKTMAGPSDPERWRILTKCAWRTGFNPSNTRRTRIFLP